jgi:5'-3' exonuclease
MQKVLLIDLGHLAHRYLFARAADIKVVGYGLLRHELLCNGIFPYISKFNPNKVYIAVDYKKSWRKVIFESYKAHRVELRENVSDVIKWEDFYEFLDQFIKDLREIFPFYVPLVPHMEADDIIGSLVKTLPSDYQKIIVTGDTDYIQLLKYDNVKLWSPNKKSFVVSDDPEKELLLKIILGDKSDNIPNCRKGVGKVGALKLINSNKLQELLNEKDTNGEPIEFRRNFDRNKRLIDMNMIPEGLITRLKNNLETYELPDGSKFFNYLVENKLREILDNISKFRQVLNPLIQKKEEATQRCHLRSIS